MVKKLSSKNQISGLVIDTPLINVFNPAVFLGFLYGASYFPNRTFWVSPFLETKKKVALIALHEIAHIAIYDHGLDIGGLEEEGLCDELAEDVYSRMTRARRLELVRSVS